MRLATLLTLLLKGDSKTTAVITILISTHFPVKQLTVDVMVCARSNSADEVRLLQFKLQSDILLLCGFTPDHEPQLIHLYNYGYPEIQPTGSFCMLQL